MSQSVRTPALPSSVAEPTDDLDGGLAISPSDILERLWHLFISMKTGLVLILALAVLGLIGTLLVQAPSGLLGDPQAYAVWLDSVRPKYGGWTGVFDALGLFSVFTSVWFKGIVVLLTTSVLACSVNRAPYLWKQATRPRLAMTDTFFAHAPLNATMAGPANLDAAAAEVESAFRSHHYRTLVEKDGDAVHLYADRFRWAPFGTVMAHLSLVVILVGAMIGSSLGFRNSEFAAPIGSKMDVGYGTGLTLEATSFTDSYNAETGAPSDYASDLVLYRDGVQVAAQTIRVNDPLRYEDVSFYQSFFGPAAAMQVKDASGAVVYDQGVPLLWSSNDGTERVGQFSLPDQGLTVFVVGAASGEISDTIKPGQMQVEVYQAGSQTPIGIEVVDQGKAATVGGLEYTFLREHQYTGLIVARDPGVPFVWGGTILLIVGICLVFFFPNRRAWALIRREEGATSVQVGAIVRHDVTFQTDFRTFVDGLRLALGGQSNS
jgi:cytochrome c biogenesis protein